MRRIEKLEERVQRLELNNMTWIYDEDVYTSVPFSISEVLPVLIKHLGLKFKKIAPHIEVMEEVKK